MCVQACLWAGNTLQRHLNRRGGAVKNVQACLNVRKDLESSFHHCGGPVKPVQACLCKLVCERKTPYSAIYTAEVELFSR